MSIREGEMIQRMLTAATLGAVLSIAAGCGLEGGNNDSSVSQLASLSGEVFIVTAGGPSIKLGLVTVTAHHEKEILDFLEKRKAVGAKMRADLAPKIESAKESIAEAEKEVTAARSAPTPSQSNSAQRAYLKCLEIAETLEECKEGRRLQGERELAAWRGRVENAEEALRERIARLEALQELSAQTDASEFHFTDMPTGFAVEKTNADGLFTMEIPKFNRIAIAARAERQVMGTMEQYFWLIWIAPNGREKIHVMLSNDNITTSGSADSVIHTAAPTRS